MLMTTAFMAGGFGWGEVVVVALVVLLLFGARRVPELARSLGRSLSEFKKGREEGGRDDKPDKPDSDLSKADAPPQGSGIRTPEPGSGSDRPTD